MKKPSSRTVTEAKIVTKSSPDIVFDAIITAIQNSTLVPGQRLVEADLTESLGVSRGPVREALKRLAAEGIVTLNQNRGAFVRALDRKDAQDLLQVLEVTCGLGANLAARQVSKGYMREEFDAVSEELLAHEDRGDSRSFIEARRKFYDILFRASGNDELHRIIPLMQIHLLRLQFQTLMSEPDRSKQFDEYRAVIAAIKAGQFIRADRLMRIHIWRSRLSISRLDDNAFQAGVDRMVRPLAAG
ncbi:GntR family transcriptional regulator [Pseudooceanicola atlanticus]|uniref:GntR family transcriptional regulator n=1 Tax=Pseudooceanicola atlanticus TaxID=1461694 RepID=UPI0009DD368C|nr:GntR family transcriptional regulator [Pseudooceanicola atlanticus]